MFEISRKEAQALAVIASRLDRKHLNRRVTPDDILETILHLGMIQLDTISVVSRSHETALWSRIGHYDRDHLTELFSRNALTEYLTHAAAITPTVYLPLTHRMMERYRTDDSRWIHEPDIVPIVRGVLQRIESEGPLSSRDFEAPPNTARLGQWESWYGTKLERKVLASLWASGDLLISLRDRAFTRWYDLPARVAPHHHHREAVPVEILAPSLINHAMRALGVATVPWLTDYWRTGGPSYLSGAEVRAAIPMLVQQRQIIPVNIEGISESTWMAADMVPVLEELRSGSGWPTKTTFLSPFDNLIWNRNRMEQLWGMHYRLEIYTPAPKRVFGYYSMPILYRGQLIGRFDPSMNRKTGLLTIRTLHMEPDVKLTVGMANAIASTLDEFVRFLGGNAWEIEQTNPSPFGAEIRQRAG